MTETIFIEIREEVSRELCNCSYEDMPPEYESIVEEEAHRRYEDWKEDEHDRLNEGTADRDSIAQAELSKRIGI